MARVYKILLLTGALLVSGLQQNQHPLQGHKKHHTSLTDDLVSFHRNLTSIESITGNEEHVSNWLAKSLHGQGYEVQQQCVENDPPRCNVLAWLGGDPQNAKVLVTSHIDTVPPFIPYTHHNSTDNRSISGRGSVDAKGSVASQVIAANRLISSDKVKPSDLVLLYVVGEEVGGDGMRAANDLKLSPHTVVFGEPTEGKLASGHKGNMGILLHAKGKAAHSGYPWLGRSAVEVLVKSLAALMELGANLPESDKYGFTTFNFGRIDGGVASNVVAQNASAQIAVRIAEGTPEFIRDEVTKTIHLAIETFLEGDMKPEDVIDIVFPTAGYGPIDIDHDVPGFDVMTVNYGTDIPWLKKTVEGQKRYLYGPGSILVAHSDHEAITEGQLWDAVDGYQRIILHALGKEPCDDC